MKKLAIFLLIMLCASFAYAEKQPGTDKKALIDSTNSTISNLGNGGVFTGTSTDTLNYASGTVSIFTDQNSATNGLSIEYSTDGTNWDHAHSYSVMANESRGIPFDATEARYMRIVYTNGTTPQGAFRLQTRLSRTPSSPHYHSIDFVLKDDHVAAVVKAVLAAQKPNGDYVNINATAGGNLPVSLEEWNGSFNTSPLPVSETSKTAFGEVLVAELTPIVQIHSAYNINTRIIEARDNNGASSIVNNKFQVSTGASANQMSSLLSRVAVKYNSGQGGLWRGTALFTTGVANSTQYIGIGTASEGYFFGYNGTAFGILRRQGGSPEVRTLTVTTKSSHIDTITITLDGDADNTVSVTNGADTTITANEIADHDYSDLGQGWSAHSMGANVIFESYNAALQTGTYSLTDATSAIGTFAQTVAGVAPTETVVAQTSWSEDKAAGAETLPNLTFTNGNVFQIRYGWLGFDGIQFSIKHPSTLSWILAHKMEYANANTIPSLDNPTLPLCMAVKNTSNTSDIVLQSASMMGGVEGKNIQEGILNAAVVETTNIGTTETPILSIHNHTVYQSKVNRIRVKIDELGVSFDASAANKPAVLRLRLNPTLTGASFSAIDANTSVVRKDTSATAVSGGILFFAQSLAEGAAPIIDLEKRDIILNPGDTITISLEASNGTIDPDVSLGWKELF